MTNRKYGNTSNYLVNHLHLAISAWITVSIMVEIPIATNWMWNLSKNSNDIRMAHTYNVPSNRYKNLLANVFIILK
jgi:hypothetical protein